jgi:hypothetical protein
MPFDTTRLTRINPILGALLWLVALLFSSLRLVTFNSLSLLLLLAILPVTPLALFVVRRSDSSPSFPTYQLPYLYWPAALTAFAAFLLSPGLPAALLVLPWFLYTVAIAFYGLQRLHGGFSSPATIEETVIAFGLIYLAIGGFWLILSRGNLPLAQFREPIVTLTAIHFHYISLGALVIGGVSGRLLRHDGVLTGRLYQLAATGLISGPPLVAVGITFSVVIEALASLVLALSLTILAILTLLRIVPTRTNGLQRLLLTISSAAVLFAMTFALAYAYGRLSGDSGITIPTMINVHGWVNAVGFTLAGLSGWAFSTPQSATS